jgi:hypothetical protein
MSSEALIVSKPPFITAHLQKFRETRSLGSLVQAVILVLRQQRTLELFYGVYCNLFHRPSTVLPSADQSALISILKQKAALAHRGTLSRAQLIELYGERFKVELLPQNFQSARSESIWRQGDEFLVIGEYGEGSRLAFVTSRGCVMSEHYRQIRGVRHIHSIEGFGDSGEFLVATGDTKKFLDLWVIENGELRFVRTLRRQLAGFTAAIRVNGKYFFGTDFSSRPNYIATLSGAKFFFPRKAYKMYVTGFYAFLDRYIVSINNELRVVGGRQTLSVFDTALQRFIYCEYLTEDSQRTTSRAA